MLNEIFEYVIIFTALTFQVEGILTKLSEAHSFRSFLFSGPFDLGSDPTVGSCLEDPTF